MFNYKTYKAVNREERFYCSLFAHALLSSLIVRMRLRNRIREKCDLALSPEDMEVFLEAAILRDYWNDLGNPSVYDALTHQRRLDVLRLILSLRGIDCGIIEKSKLFWTSWPRDANKSKLWSPSRWIISDDYEQTLSKVDIGELEKIKEAFNAKPDMLLISGTGILIIEAKLESGLGKYTKGNDQIDAQKLIATLIAELIPIYRGVRVETCLLELPKNMKSCDEKSIHLSWADVVDCCGVPDLDNFTRTCFGIMADRYGF